MSVYSQSALCRNSSGSESRERGTRGVGTFFFLSWNEQPLTYLACLPVLISVVFVISISRAPRCDGMSILLTASYSHLGD